MLREVLDLYWLDRIREGELEDARVEVELGFERALDGFGFAEAVLFASEGQVGEGEVFGAQGFDHPFGLGRWDDAIFEALEQDHGAGQLIGEVDWRARGRVCG